jgi:hypothetical protein
MRHHRKPYEAAIKILFCLALALPVIVVPMPGVAPSMALLPDASSSVFLFQSLQQNATKSATCRLCHRHRSKSGCSCLMCCIWHVHLGAPAGGCSPVAFTHTLPCSPPLMAPCTSACRLSPTWIASCGSHCAMLHALAKMQGEGFSLPPLRSSSAMAFFW